MSEIAALVGQRIRNYRIGKNLSQEALAELAGCHPTYIGQVERGEKNATLESIARICAALDLPLSQLFEKLEDAAENSGRNIPFLCYEFLSAKTEREQEQLYSILLALDAYKQQR